MSPGAEGGVYDVGRQACRRMPEHAARGAVICAAGLKRWPLWVRRAACCAAACLVLRLPQLRMSLLPAASCCAAASCSLFAAVLLLCCSTA